MEDKIIILTITDSKILHRDLTLIAQKVTQYTLDLIQEQDWQNEEVNVYHRIEGF